MLNDWINRLRNPGRAKTACDEPDIDFDRQLGGAGQDFDRWFRRLAEGRQLYVEIDASRVRRLRDRYPAAAAGTLAAAERILAHEFQLLGSRPFVPHDPRRQRGTYRAIDWLLDPVSGRRFPAGIPYKEWKLESMAPRGADIKLPWELARCQHWAALGQAYRLTGDSRYALEIAAELEDFAEANPTGTGIHWTCTMDVALRAASWAIGLAMIKGCPALPQPAWRSAYDHLFRHGEFIFNNFENHYEVTSNHFLSNLVGLYFLAAVFRDLPRASMWGEFCRSSIEKEMEVQVLQDGSDFESSVPYHRLVAEMFLGAARLAEMMGEPFPRHYLDRLRSMVQFLADVLRPDGLMPQIGDADDGRLHILGGYGNWQPQDGRHLFAPAALVLQNAEWLHLCGPHGLWEASWWGLEAPGEEPRPHALPPVRRHFPEAGLAVVRDQGSYLLVSNGPVGTRGFGNHKHNDQLGFEYHAAGHPLVVDPGSYVYTPDPAARNLFRGTAYHSTLCVDETEQNEMKPEWLFRLFETARPEHIEFRDAGRDVVYTGRHRGYERLGQPMTHERSFRFSRDSAALSILDTARGSGTHRMHWHFHIAPEVRVDRLEASAFRLAVDGACFRLESLDALEGRVADAWYSPSYGVRVPCRAIDFKEDVSLNGERRWRFRIGAE